MTLREWAGHRRRVNNWFLKRRCCNWCRRKQDTTRKHLESQDGMCDKCWKKAWL